MADITMCTAKDCPFKDICYRKTATASLCQSFSNFEPYINKDKTTCEGIMLNKTNKPETT